MASLHNEETAKGEGTDLSINQTVPHTIEQTELFKIDYQEEKTDMEHTVDTQVEERDLLNPIPDQCPRHILSRPLKVISGPLGSFESRTIILNWFSRYKPYLDTFT